MKNRNVIIILGIISFIIIVGGISFSFFVYNKDLGNVTINTGAISIDFSDKSGGINLTYVVPKNDATGKTSSDYIDFTINATVEAERIYYEIYIAPDSNSTLNTDYLKTYLSDQSENVVSPVTNYNQLPDSESGTGKAVYRGILEVNNDHSTRNESNNYRLRLWIDEEYPELTAQTFDFDVYLYARNVDYDDLENSLYNVIAGLESTKEYINTYTGNHNDTMLGSGSKTIYYYTGEDGANNSNVMFAGLCWQIVRTTDDGGVKLLFNGPVRNNKCADGRAADRAFTVSSQTTTSVNLNNKLYYSDSFTYTSSSFSLQNYERDYWSIDNYKKFYGLYTNTSTSGNSQLRYFTRYVDSTHANILSYGISSSNSFIQSIGSSYFNAHGDSLAHIGYMFNDIYPSNSGLKSGNHLYGNDITYHNGKYTLVTTQSLLDNTHHYTCDSNVENETECEKVRFYYRTNIVSGTTNYYYIVLENGKKIDDALKEMINYKTNDSDTDANINIYNSPIKGIVENWFFHYFKEYGEYFDYETIYCNRRRVNNLGGWNKDGSLSTGITFTASNDLGCVNVTDSFSVKNGKAKLKYPIGLLTNKEVSLLGTGYHAKGWIMTAYGDYVSGALSNGADNTTGGVSAYGVNSSQQVQPVITLKPGITISGGDGTKDTPYIIFR